MKDHQLIAGFSDIKSALCRTYNIEPQAREIRLWFTQEGSAIYAHDYSNHSRRIRVWDFGFPKNSALAPSSLGYRTIEYIVAEGNKPEIAQELNLKYRYLGFRSSFT